VGNTNIENDPQPNASQALRKCAKRVNFVESCDLAKAHLEKGSDRKLRYMQNSALLIRDNNNGLWIKEGNMQIALINAIFKNHPGILLASETRVGWQNITSTMKKNGYEHIDENGHDNLSNLLQNRWATIKVSGE
jgi:hypothetical protein